MSEATSALNFSKLIAEVAYKLGMASYGDDGTGVPALPTDAHDLSVCKRVVNNGIRMFINDAPNPAGWRWLRPVGSVTIWPSVAATASNVVTAATFSSTTGLTTLTVTSAAFYPTMELKTITLDSTDFTISGYISSSTVTVTGDASGHIGDTFAIASDSAYTLPLGFGGQVDGHATYAAGTNRGTSLAWVDESIIRERQSNVGEESGTPFRLAVRIKDTGTPRRRWELVVDRTPSEVFVILFPYTIHFDLLVALSDVPPTPIGHDEAVKAACLATAEKEVEDTFGVDWQYYRSTALPNSYRVDAKSAPRRLGYFGNGGRQGRDIRDFRDNQYQRPTVTVNP